MNQTVLDYDPKCHFPAWYWTLSANLNAFFLYILPFVYVACNISYCLNIWFCIRQSKTEKTYIYQIYVSVFDIVTAFFFMILLVTRFLSGSTRFLEGNPWYKQSYALMFFLAHFAAPLCSGMDIATLLLAISLVIDRIFAFRRPFDYKLINHQCHRRAALALCLFLGMSCASYNVPLRYVIPSNSSGYEIGVNFKHIRSSLGTTMAVVGNTSHFLAVICLTVSNVILVRLYRKRVKNMPATTSSNERQAKKEVMIRATEKALFIIAVSQSVFKGIRISVSTAYYTGIYISPSFIYCAGVLVGISANLTIMICCLAEAYVATFINWQTTAVIRRTLRQDAD